MRSVIAFILLMNLGGCLFAQNIIIQQNNNQTTKNRERVVEKVVEKPVYIKEKSSKPSTPICLFGYLYVYPEDLGLFKVYPESVVNNINKHKAYGKMHWRLPTIEELSLLKEHADKLNLRRYEGGWCAASSMYWYEGMGSAEKSCGPQPIRLVCTE